MNYNRSKKKCSRHDYKKGPYLPEEGAKLKKLGPFSTGPFPELSLEDYICKMHRRSSMLNFCGPGPRFEDKIEPDLFFKSLYLSSQYQEKATRY